MRPARPLALAALLSTLLLTGCVESPPEIQPPPEPSTAPIFATDEEALAAATDAYAAYLKVSDQIGQEAGENPQRLEPYVTAEWFADELEALDSFAKSGRHQEGSTSFDSMRLQQIDQLNSSEVLVVVYVCVDFSGTRLLDSEGKDVTALHGETRWPFEVTFQATTATNLLIGGHEEWSRSGIC